MKTYINERLGLTAIQYTNEYFYRIIRKNNKPFIDTVIAEIIENSSDWKLVDEIGEIIIKCENQYGSTYDVMIRDIEKDVEYDLNEDDRHLAKPYINGLIKYIRDNKIK